MQLRHESSSLVVSQSDMLYGKHFSPHSSSLSIGNVNVYCEIYGIFGNLTKRFATRLDDFQILCEDDCIIPENYLFTKFALDTLVAIAEETDFWSGVPTYPWFWPLFGELFKMSKSNIYLLADWEFGEQLSDRYMWVKKNFGSVMMERLIFTSDGNRVLLPKSPRDLLIDCDLSNIEKWVSVGGSAFYYPELHWDCENRANILVKRLELIRNAIKVIEK